MTALLTKLTCYRVGGCGTGGGASRADHAGVAAAGSTDTAGAGAAVAAPLPALSGATGPLPGAVLSDVVTHLTTTHSSQITLFTWRSIVFISDALAVGVVLQNATIMTSY